MTAKTESIKLREPSEKEVQKTILDWLAWHKIFAWRNNSGCVFSNYKGKTRMIRIGCPGAPDIIGIFKGLFLGIEVKAKKGKLRPEQKEFLDNIKKYGGIAIVAKSVEDVEESLNKIV